VDKWAAKAANQSNSELRWARYLVRVGPMESSGEPRPDPGDPIGFPLSEVPTLPGLPMLPSAFSPVCGSPLPGCVIEPRADPVVISEPGTIEVPPVVADPAAVPPVAAAPPELPPAPGQRRAL
jgi:hypothetical protein